MDDLISRSALIEELKLYEKELKSDREVAIESDDEQMLFAIMNQETAICRFRRNVLHIPTAYDIEKVVAELKKAGFSDESAPNRVVDIVRKGGVE